ncbi:[FeFe] hydrogenase H-cluster radical SAM maturase HydG [Terrisporobacter mayombei]|uniref:Cyclic dehypoxanthine futalosine synthase n=1 Tax=Terrisporobacter mayombei TaxID=1541 RepID=A0ABY9Q744_9FIRM|nr:[FeFe] hydrogenase H-cluster radical SAM maturase HydG [Terrisporobacter mayombei]MCC3868695.1 [FeFe] hydrogenase H-cluster radical SAM maturase HydG [Terrisporobacter mayombei]WMT83179.1 Cyclic dehypoxanthine futalosine synthase [Terrisporobacter mayombei]
MVYDPKSRKAEEFINHEEILESLEYAKSNKGNKELIEGILDKANRAKGLTHREAATLLECEDEELIERMFKMAEDIKKRFYGNRIVMFAPLYLSNYCVNGCVYCPYHLKNKKIARKKLTQEEIKREVIALQDLGHKRLALEAGEDPKNNPIEYILESINTIYSIKHKNGAIRRVNVNIAATTIENYEKLKDAGIGTYILFQETYNKESYEKLHPTGPKHDYNYHTESHDRAMEAGIDDVGLGVLYGLSTYKYELVGILMHAEHLEAAFGVGPHTISVPRLRPADDIDVSEFPEALSDEIFQKIVAIIRLAVPYTGMIVSTRESQKTREKVLHLGVSQISGASSTSVGGYADRAKGIKEEITSAQFDVDDDRTLDEVVNWLLDMNYIPSFCTACYREGRTGDRFMALCKNGQIANCCQPNAIMTLKEYLEDYASKSTKESGENLIKKEVKKIPKDKVREIVEERLIKIEDGERDFRF